MCRATRPARAVCTVLDKFPRMSYPAAASPSLRPPPSPRIPRFCGSRPSRRPRVPTWMPLRVCRLTGDVARAFSPPPPRRPGRVSRFAAPVSPCLFPHTSRRTWWCWWGRRRSVSEMQWGRARDMSGDLQSGPFEVRRGVGGSQAASGTGPPASSFLSRCFSFCFVFARRRGKVEKGRRRCGTRARRRRGVCRGYRERAQFLR